MKYRVDGKEKRLSFGEWPAVYLKEARDKRGEAKKQLRGSLDPSAEKKKVKIEQAAPTFRDIALEYVEKQRGVWAETICLCGLARPKILRARGQQHFHS